MLPLEQIIERCKKNETKAQKMLYNKYASTLMGICLRYTKDKAEAEDVLQEGFLKIFLNIQQYEGKGSFEGWMKRIVINTAISHYHQNIHHRYHQDIENVTEDEVDIYNFDSEYTIEELLGAIRKLPEGYRMVFNLYVIEGYKHHEIAEILNIDASTSKSQLSRAKSSIRSILTELKKESLPVERL